MCATRRVVGVIAHNTHMVTQPVDNFGAEGKRKGMEKANVVTKGRKSTKQSRKTGKI